MEIIVLGANGQLGKALAKTFPEAELLTREICDLAKAEDIERLRLSSNTVIINAAAYTQVDDAETEEGSRDAWNVNAAAVINLAQKCKKSGATLVHFSTDYVFDGKKEGEYTEQDTPHPLNVYGASKVAGDDGALSNPQTFVLRTSWVYGDGKNFVNSIVKASLFKNELTVVADQFGRPTNTQDIASAVKHLLEKKSPFGLYNVSNSGKIATWADIARETFRILKKDITITETTADEYFKNKVPHANRPKNSALSLAKIEQTAIKLRTWQDALADFLK